MTEADSSDQFFSATDADVDGDKPRKTPYADDSILICTLPETSSSSTSTSLKTGQTLDPPSIIASQPVSVARKRSSVLKRKAKCAKIRSSDSDEEKRDESSGKERLDDENVNPSFAADTLVGSGDRKDGDGLNESILLSEKLQFALLDVARMMCEKQNKRFEDMDILEIAAMKGIHFPPPSWWRPGGYGPKKQP
ncbi:uncharacterized protein LOC110028618 isoform X2 [Phalaenopsis equestris]|uniref:uncharacterized protein LOC110028618 isoform X2 n=1 Tax=Phalaenopsis equestris TaxID=78828 RepID=UPI0009E2D6F5|nr:uncharacterized protein LOC110028618 isoform X2 [Phalaenopsis equestris]